MSQRQELHHHQNRFSRKRLLFFGISLLLLMSGTIIWILTQSSILWIVFTALSVLIPLLQWLFPSSVGTRLEIPSSPLIQQHLPNIQAQLGVSKRKGALIIIADKTRRGAPTHLYRDFDSNSPHPTMIKNIVLRNIDSSLTGLATFAALEPGNYTVSICGEEQKTNVTIQAGQIEEVDWRHPQWKKSVSTKGRFRLW